MFSTCWAFFFFFGEEKTPVTRIRNHVPTCQKVSRLSIELPGRPATSLFLFFFNLTYSRWTSSLPSCLWSQRIFPSLPGSRLTTFLSRCKFSTLTTRQPMVEFYLLAFPRFPLRKKENKSYFGKNRTHDFRTSRCADYLLDHSGYCNNFSPTGGCSEGSINRCVQITKMFVVPVYTSQTISSDNKPGPTAVEAKRPAIRRYTERPLLTYLQTKYKQRRCLVVTGDKCDAHKRKASDEVKHYSHHAHHPYCYHHHRLTKVLLNDACQVLFLKMVQENGYELL